MVHQNNGKRNSSDNTDNPPNPLKRTVFEFLAVAVGGALFTALIWLLYAGIYNVLEAIFYPNDPLSFPADQLRFGTATVFLLIYMVIFRKIKSKLLSATISVAPVSMFLIMIVLSFYTRMYLWVSIISVIILLLTVGLIKFKARWYFYFSLGYSLLIALVYAWPR